MKLTTKDRLTLGVGAVILLVFVVIQFGLLPILDKRERLTRAIERNESAVVRMGEIETQYRQLNQQSNSLSRQIDRRPAGFSLFSFLEKAAVDSEVKEHIVYETLGCPRRWHAQADHGGDEVAGNWSQTIGGFY